MSDTSEYDRLISRAATHRPLAPEASVLEYGLETRVRARLKQAEEAFSQVFSRMLWRSAAALGPSLAVLTVWFALSHSINLSTTASTTSDLVAELRHLVTAVRPL